MCSCEQLSDSQLCSTCRQTDPAHLLSISVYFSISFLLRFQFRLILQRAAAGGATGRAATLFTFRYEAQAREMHLALTENTARLRYKDQPQPVRAV